MPRRSLQLNDFSGGLNTKSSPRDIAPNQVTKADNVNLHNPGLILSSSTSSAKLSTANAPNAQTTAGYGAFMFNSQYNTDVSGTEGNPVQVFAFPENNASGTSTKILTYARDFGSTGNFTLNEASGDAQIDMQTENEVLPVYYYVDGSLFVSDEKVVDETTDEQPRRLVYVKDATRLGTDISSANKWVDTTLKIETSTTQFEDISNTDTFSTNPSDDGEFSVILQTDPTFDSQDFNTIIKTSSTEKLVTTTNPDETNPDQTADIRITDKIIYLTLQGVDNDLSSQSLDYKAGDPLTDVYPAGAFTSANMDGKIIYINGEAMRVRGVSYKSTPTNSNDILQLIVDRAVFTGTPLEHAGASEVQVVQDTSIAVTGGGWEAGSYEFCHTVIDLQDNETLPQTPKTDLFAITSGAYFTGVKFRIKDAGTWRINEKGVRIYTRKKDGNGRWILFLDVDYQRGVRKNLFEDYQALSQVDTLYHENSTAFDIVNPSLDTYESINGYSQDEESIDIGTGSATGTAGGFKAATVCARRAWVANVKKNGKVYDDRIYYTPVNRFATFPNTYYLDIGINDGDSFTALHSLGNRLLAFKQKKLYVINVSSSSDAGWYLEAEYDGMGCIFQNTVSKTPFGVCWVNRDGVYIFDGTSAPKELTARLDDDLWQKGQELSDVLLKPSISYEPKYKQLYVLQDSAMTSNSGVETENRVFCYDFATQGWTTRQCVGSQDVSNFVESFDGVYFFKHSDDKIHKLTNDSGTQSIDLRTKDLDFGNPGLVKRVNRVFVTARGNGTNLTLGYANDGESTYNDLASQALGTEYSIKEFTIDTADRNCESMALKITADGTIDINDINIDYRQTNKRPS